jgi:hypothetical protein
VIGFLLSAQHPPEPRRVNDTVVMRFDHVYEVEPSLMQQHIQQHEFPAWETSRIVNSRWEHLDWMHAHWADSVISAEELLDESERQAGRPDSETSTTKE